MKLKTTLLFGFCLFAFLSSKNQNFEAQVLSDFIEDEFVRGYDIKIDPLGNIIIAGLFKGEICLDPNNSDNLLYEVPSEDEQAASVFIVKYNPELEYLWGFSIGNDHHNEISYNEIQVDLDGNIILLGGFEGEIDMDPSLAEYILNFEDTHHVWDPVSFLAKYDSSGEFISARAIGGTSINVSPTSYRYISLNNDGAIFLGGKYRRNIEVDPDYEIIEVESPNDIYENIFVTKLNSELEVEWFYKTEPNTTSSSLWFGMRDQTLIDDNQLILCGYLQGSVHIGGNADDISTSSTYERNAYLISIDVDSGSPLWSGVLGYTDDDENYDSDSINNITKTEDGELLCFGKFYLDSDLDPSDEEFIVSAENNNKYYISKVSGEGDLLWVKTFQGEGSIWLNDLIETSSGDIVFSGLLTDDIDFDPGIEEYILEANFLDEFLCILDNNGNLVQVQKVSPELVTHDLNIRGLESTSNGIMLLMNYENDSQNDFFSQSLNLTTQGFGMAIIELNNIPLSINTKNEDANNLIFPNPASKYIYFDYMESGLTEISIYNSSGKLVLKKNISLSNRVNINHLKSGIYLVRTNIGESYKFIKE